MSTFAAICRNNETNETKETKIIGFGASKSASSRRANRAVTDPYGNRNPKWSEIHICEFETLAEAREYVARIPKQ